MQRTSTSRAGFFNPRIFFAFTLCSVGLVLAVFSFVPPTQPSRGGRNAERFERDMPVPGGEPDDLNRLELEWHNRLTYPTGIFNPTWLRQAALQDATIARNVPVGVPSKNLNKQNTALTLSANSFVSLGPQPLHMTGCSSCFDFTTTEGRVNDIVVDPTTTTNGSIVAYLGSVGGGVWKTTNCCSASTSWTAMTNDPLISTVSIDSLTIDPNNHNTIYAGTGDL
ncbi:MAG: hypothetical protein QOI22_1819, partial [Verrucomicrobiota bacterium]